MWDTFYRVPHYQPYQPISGHHKPRGDHFIPPITHMHYLHLTDIVIEPNRQRRNFDEQALSELADSIARNGLLHPVVVRSTSEGPAVLVAGERRIRAIQMLELQSTPYTYAGEVVPPGMVPATDIGEVSEAAAFEAELVENLIRVDLTWQEETEAIAMLHKLQELKSGEPQSPYKTGPAILPSMSPVAAGTAVRQAIVLQRHIAADPEVAKAKSVAEAMKIVKRKEMAALNAALAAEVGKKAVTDLHIVVNADCREWLAAADSRQFDCILIDPPYGMGADSFGDGAGTLSSVKHNYDDSPETANSLLSAIAADLFRVAKDEAHLYVWCDIDNFVTWRELMRATGWKPFRTPLINVKREGGRVPWPDQGPRRCYEIVLYAVKGNRPVTALYRDVFESTLQESADGHGAIKPVEAYVELLKRSCKPGDVVLDCFAGTGTIIEAAHQLRLRSVAVEIDPSYYGRCLKRLETLK